MKRKSLLCGNSTTGKLNNLRKKNERKNEKELKP